MTETPPLYGLVLAGGESRRMGRDKALLQHDGRSQLAHAFALLDAICECVFVSTRASQRNDPERTRFPLIVDRYDDIGPAAGILTALETHPGVDWLVVACDLPNVDRSTLAELLRHRAGTRPFAAFASSQDGLPEPLCAIYRAGSLDVVRRFVDSGTVCPRKMMIRSDAELIEQPDPAALDNINTPEDLAGSILAAPR